MDQDTVLDVPVTIWSLTPIPKFVGCKWVSLKYQVPASTAPKAKAKARPKAAAGSAAAAAAASPKLKHLFR
eukprot:4869522-Pyramimonas_sp.AAC.1